MRMASDTKNFNIFHKFLYFYYKKINLIGELENI